MPDAASPRNAGYEIGGMKRKSGGIFVQDKKHHSDYKPIPRAFPVCAGNFKGLLTFCERAARKSEVDRAHQKLEQVHGFGAAGPQPLRAAVAVGDGETLGDFFSLFAHDRRLEGGGHFPDRFIALRRDLRPERRGLRLRVQVAAEVGLLAVPVELDDLDVHFMQQAAHRFVDLRVRAVAPAVLQVHAQAAVVGQREIRIAVKVFPQAPRLHAALEHLAAGLAEVKDGVVRGARRLVRAAAAGDGHPRLHPAPQALCGFGAGLCEVAAREVNVHGCTSKLRHAAQGLNGDLHVDRAVFKVEVAEDALVPFLARERIGRPEELREGLAAEFGGGRHRGALHLDDRAALLQALFDLAARLAVDAVGRPGFGARERHFKRFERAANRVYAGGLQRDLLRGRQVVVRGALVAHGGLRHKDVPGRDPVVERAAAAEREELLHAHRVGLFEQARGGRPADRHVDERERKAVRQGAAVNRHRTHAAVEGADLRAAGAFHIGTDDFLRENADHARRHVRDLLNGLFRVDDGGSNGVEIRVKHGLSAPFQIYFSYCSTAGRGSQGFSHTPPLSPPGAARCGRAAKTRVPPLAIVREV